MTFAEAVEEIGRASGRELRYEPVSMDEFASALAGQGVEKEVVEFMRYLFVEVLDGRNKYLGHGVEQALGRQPRDFSDYARDAAGRGVWTPSAVAA